MNPYIRFAPFVPDSPYFIENMKAWGKRKVETCIGSEQKKAAKHPTPGKKLTLPVLVTPVYQALAFIPFP